MNLPIYLDYASTTPVDPRVVEKMQDKMDSMMDSDEEIMDQHKKLFEKLEQGNTGYSYN